jgi:hypothetical protein
MVEHARLRISGQSATQVSYKFRHALIAVLYPSQIFDETFSSLGHSLRSWRYAKPQGVTAVTLRPCFFADCLQIDDFTLLVTYNDFGAGLPGDDGWKISLLCSPRSPVNAVLVRRGARSTIDQSPAF